MSFWEIIDTILLKSLGLIFETVYMLAYKVIGNPGLSIIVLSLFMNFLVLPLYMRADAIQEEEHDLEKKLQKGVDHIKRTFTGDERMLLLQTYYRQNHYRPVYVLRSAVSLLLQIPFFIAAYRFLSELSLLNGVSFGPVTDLSRQDGLLQIAGVSINVLPVIMTVVNLVSCAVFTKGSPLKAKIQLYAMALFFLIFLYRSPSGLVFYWTLNNVFSLTKNVLYKLKDPKKILNIACLSTGVMAAVCIFLMRSSLTMRKAAFFAGIAVLLQVPAVYGVLKKRIVFRREPKTEDKKLFITGALFLTVLTGALIPSAVINASPQEFVDTISFYHPIWFIISSLCLAFGLFMFWTGVFYFLAKSSVRAYFDRAAWIFSGIAVADYMIFGKDLGNLNSHLKFDDKLQYEWKDIGINFVVVLGIALLFYIICRKWTKIAAELLAAGVFAFTVMTAVNIAGINIAINNMDRVDGEEDVPEFQLSRTGKNVIVLMMDRAMGEYIPYIFHDKPELEEKYAGFTWYANMVSFGCATNFGTPALFGGYEYTPMELNRRSTESLAEKHDEALKVMPVLFEKNGFDVTVCDPPYAGYQWFPDLSIYDDYPGIKTYIADGRFNDPVIAEQGIETGKRNFFCYSLLKVVPVCLQDIVYDYGNYNRAETKISYTSQYRDSLYSASGMSGPFLSAYNVLGALPEITEISDKETNTFLMMSNNTTHEGMILQEPEYIPKMWIDNSEYAMDSVERFTLNGETLKMETELQVVTYHANVAALLKLGEWFDYMREEGVYDNTKIIIVSDHGWNVQQLDDYVTEGGFDIESYYSLLMVKDFGSKDFRTSEEFMTGADVPAIAAKDAVEEPANPFTGKRLGYGDKALKPQYIIESDAFDIGINNGNQFLPADWYAVQGDMRKPENWKLVAEDALLPLDD